MGQREVGAIGGALECQGPEGQKARLASLVYKVLMGGMDCLGNQGWMGCMAEMGWMESLDWMAFQALQVQRGCLGRMESTAIRGKQAQEALLVQEGNVVYQVQGADQGRTGCTESRVSPGCAPGRWLEPAAGRRGC